jgi:hypothetical protein
VAAPSEWNDVARAKLARVLGAAEGERVFAATLAKMGKQRLVTVDDAYRFAQILKQDSPVVAAIGSMLALSAVIQGARPEEAA